MTNVEYSHLLLPVVYLIDDAIVPHSNAPRVTAPHLEATGRSRVLGQGANGIPHSLVGLRMQTR
jgi:hypothetical protein